MNYYKERFMLISEEGMYEIIDEITFLQKKLLHVAEIVKYLLKSDIWIFSAVPLVQQLKLLAPKSSDPVIPIMLVDFKWRCQFLMELKASSALCYPNFPMVL